MGIMGTFGFAMIPGVLLTQARMIVQSWVRMMETCGVAVSLQTRRKCKRCQIGLIKTQQKLVDWPWQIVAFEHVLEHVGTLWTQAIQTVLACKVESVYTTNCLLQTKWIA